MERRGLRTLTIPGAFVRPDFSACFFCSKKNRRSSTEKGPRPLSRHEEQFLWDRLYDKLYLPRVYLDGAAPDNDYTPSQPLTVTLHGDPRPQDMQPGYVRLYFKIAGADSPRSIVLRQKASTGEWFLWEYPAILMGVKTPVSQDPWA